jgi:ABC-type transport system involved in multi-copper enzyme maturation permease subunit
VLCTAAEPLLVRRPSFIIQAHHSCFLRLPVVQPWIFRLLFGALALPVLMCVLFGLAYLLSALDDDPGAAVVVRVNLALAVLWVFNLILLVLTLAIDSVVHSAEEMSDDESILVQTDDELK